MIGWQIEDAPYQHWIKNVETPSCRLIEPLPSGVETDNSWPRISIVMPTFNTPPEFLRAALDSVVAQSYPKWQLCIADDGSDNPEVAQLLQLYASRESRIVVTLSEQNGGIASASNRALGLAQGQYIAFMDHDDTLSLHALRLVAEHFRNCSSTQLLYTDSDSIDTVGKRSNPFFKPSWNYDLFLGQNYLNHLSVYRSELIRDIGGLREDFEGSQDYDLGLRAIEHAASDSIKHLPHILYHWRVLPSAVSQTNLGNAVRSGRRALREHLQRSRYAGTVSAPESALLYNRVSWDVPNPHPSTHIVVYGHDPQLLNISTNGIRKVSVYDNFTVSQVLTVKGATSPPLGEILGKQCERIAEDYICFIAAGFCPQSPDWLQRLAGILNRSEVGVAAPSIIDANNAVLCGPLIMGLENWWQGSLPVTTTSAKARSNDGYFKRLRLDHRVSAVQGVCFATKRAALEEVGGINTQLTSVPLLGADLCLKFQQHGYGTVWVSSIKLQYSNQELPSILQGSINAEELAKFEQTWPETKACDPYYNPNLSCAAISYQLPITR